MKIQYKIAFLLLALLLIFVLSYTVKDKILRRDTSIGREVSHNVDLIMKMVPDGFGAFVPDEVGKRRRKKILIYTPLFGSIPWWQIPYNYNFITFEGPLCPAYDCIVTYDKNQLSSSDLVLFHGWDLPSTEHMKSISKNERSPNQHWLFFMHESPVHSYFNAPSLNGVFNLTASYRSDSDILVTYWYYDPLQDGDPRPKDGQNFAEGKTKLITWVNSHCDADRITFIEKLRKYVSLDVYGGCSRHFKPQTPDCPRNSKKCEEYQHQYKFFLAAENSFCIDYITEKYWLNGLAAGLVPVVFGHGDYKDEKLAIPGSYIDGRKFTSMKELADYLIYLDKNDEAYNKYHQWRYKYKLSNHHFMCILCKAIQNHNLPRKSVDLEKFWGKHTCDLDKKPLRRLIATA